MRNIAIILFIAVALAIPAPAADDLHVDTVKKVRAGKLRIELTDLFSLYNTDAKIVLLDTRGPKPFAEGHFPTAKNLPGWEVKKDNPALPAMDAFVVCYCDGSGCSMSYYAAEKLLELGYKTVMVYNGGVREWEKSGLPLVTNQQEKSPQVGIGDVKILAASDGALFDTRVLPFGVFKTIPGAKILPFDQIEKSIALLPQDKSALIVLFGQNPLDSTAYAAREKLVALGYSNVRIFKNGYAGSEK